MCDDRPMAASTTRSCTATVTTDAKGRLLVRLPFDPDDAWGTKVVHRVAGTINGERIRAAVERIDGARCFVLFKLWRGRLEPGDEVALVLWPEGPQRADLAPDIEAALDAAPEAGEFFDSLAQFYRKGYLRWVDATKRRPEVRAARIAEMVELLKAGRKERPRGG